MSNDIEMEFDSLLVIGLNLSKIFFIESLPINGLSIEILLKLTTSTPDSEGTHSKQWRKFEDWEIESK